MTSLRQITLGVAIGDADHGVREQGGPNTGPRVRKYLENAGINVAAPWCAAAVQYWSDVAARMLAVPNPLDDVKLEALVQSYYNWGSSRSLLLKPEHALPGDLVLYNFHAKRWDHIGLLLDTPTDGAFRAVEGNTNEAGSREGDGVLVRVRSTAKGYPVAFVRWSA